MTEVNCTRCQDTQVIQIKCKARCIACAGEVGNTYCPFCHGEGFETYTTGKMCECSSEVHTPLYQIFEGVT